MMENIISGQIMNKRSAKKAIFAPGMGVMGYFRQQGFALIECLKNIVRAPFASLLTLAVIAFAAALPLMLWLFFANVQNASQHWQGTQMSIYLKKAVAEQDAQRLVTQLKQNSAIAHVEYIPPEQGIKDFEKQTGLTNVLDALPENPLPAVIVAYPAAAVTTAPAKAEALAGALKSNPEVDFVQLDREWVQRVSAFVTLGKQAAFGLAVLLGGGVLLIIVNAIRMTTQAVRDKIQAIKLLGGSNRFIRRPFLYMGLFYSMAGSALAVLLVNYLLAASAAPLQQLASLYQARLTLIGISDALFYQIVLASAAVGYIGAWLSLFWSLRKTQI